VIRPWHYPLNFADVPSLFCQWQLPSSANTQAKGPLAVAWTNLPKFTCWKLWLERNSRIFKDVCSSPSQVAVQVKAMLGDYIRSQSPFNIQAPLSMDEESWLHSLSPEITMDLSPRVQSLEKWEIRKENSNFDLWCKDLGRNLLFFDGASKGNPGNAGGGGVLYGPEGDMKITYSWNLGIDSNNMAEALALWQGLNQAIIHGIQELTVVGDSKLIINCINSKTLPSSYRLCQVLRRIFLLIPAFHFIDLFHVLRKNNVQADKAANEAISLSKGILKVNDDHQLVSIP
jgi:ribonuclease HI